MIAAKNAATAALGLAAGLLIPALPAAAAEPTSGAKVRVLVHSWYVHDPYMTAQDSFRIRRVNIWVTGQPSEHWGYNVLLDPSLLLKPAAGGEAIPAYAALKDAFAIYDREGWFKLQVGQMKVPISDEFLRSTVDLDTVERSKFATKAITKDFGFYRDLGALFILSQDYGKLMGGVYNGTGDNVAANSPYKTFATRLEATPFGKMVKLGGSYLYGYNKTAPDKAGKTGEGTRSRYGGNAQLKVGDLRLDAEALMGYDQFKVDNQALGFYGQALYGLSADHDVLVRLEGWNPDTSVTDATKSRQEYSAGLGWNWKIRGQGTRVQFNYFHDFLPQGNVDDRIMTNFAVYL